MSWNIVHLADVTPTPWRNGGGVTRELVAWPVGSTDWLWRLSVAEVARSGPFSSYEGVQRWFAVLTGQGVRLQLGGKVHELTRSSAPLCFDGASAVGCELIDGSTQDFNLMLRGARSGTRMKRLSGHDQCVLDRSRTVAVYAAGSPCMVMLDHVPLPLEAHSLAWQTCAGGSVLDLCGEDALWMEMEP